MTDEEIDILSGRAIDRLVSEQIFGDYKKLVESEYHLMIPKEATLPYYSTHIEDAFEIVEAFRRGWNNHAAAVIEMVVSDDIHPEDCFCRIYAPDLVGVMASGSSMSLAICRAALKTKNHDPILS